MRDNFRRDAQLAPEAMMQNAHDPQLVSQAWEAAATFYCRSQSPSKLSRQALYSLEQNSPNEYRKYLSLGSPARFAKRGEEWVCFFPVQVDPDSNQSHRTTPRISKDHARKRRKGQEVNRSVLWFCPRAHVEQILQASLNDPNAGLFDAVRDRLGLAYLGPGRVAAVRIRKMTASRLVTVPTTLDAAGYEHFLPAPKLNSGGHPRTGVTAPLDGSSRGVREVIVWIDDQPPREKSTSQELVSSWDSVTLLMRRDETHKPCIFTVQRLPDSLGYFRRRTKMLGP